MFKVIFIFKIINIKVLYFSILIANFNILLEKYIYY